jgi:hypothetical protein
MYGTIYVRPMNATGRFCVMDVDNETTSRETDLSHEDQDPEEPCCSLLARAIGEVQQARIYTNHVTSQVLPHIQLIMQSLEIYSEHAGLCLDFNNGNCEGDKDNILKHHNITFRHNVELVKHMRDMVMQLNVIHRAVCDIRERESHTKMKELDHILRQQELQEQHVTLSLMQALSHRVA